MSMAVSTQTSSIGPSQVTKMAQLTSEEEEMASEHVDVATMGWTSGVPFYGRAAIYEGKEVVQLKVLSDRRGQGGGIAWLVMFAPPPCKLNNIDAITLSDDHYLCTVGGRRNKTC